MKWKPTIKFKLVQYPSHNLVWILSSRRVYTILIHSKCNLCKLEDEEGKYYGDITAMLLLLLLYILFFAKYEIS